MHIELPTSLIERLEPIIKEKGYGKPTAFIIDCLTRICDESNTSGKRIEIPTLTSVAEELGGKRAELGVKAQILGRCRAKAKLDIKSEAGIQAIRAMLIGVLNKNDFILLDPEGKNVRFTQADLNTYCDILRLSLQKDKFEEEEATAKAKKDKVVEEVKEGQAETDKVDAECAE
ncbi:MAG: hypothetical protein ACYDBV_13825 [Nitrospiria bacterium]